LCKNIKVRGLKLSIALENPTFGYTIQIFISANPAGSQEGSLPIYSDSAFGRSDQLSRHCDLSLPEPAERAIVVSQPAGIRPMLSQKVIRHRFAESAKAR
jgi:hypothetical protein